MIDCAIVESCVGLVGGDGVVPFSLTPASVPRRVCLRVACLFITGMFGRPRPFSCILSLLPFCLFRRYILNDACVLGNKPLVSGAAIALDSQVRKILSKRDLLKIFLSPLRYWPQPYSSEALQYQMHCTTTIATIIITHHRYHEYHQHHRRHHHHYRHRALGHGIQPLRIPVLSVLAPRAPAPPSAGASLAPKAMWCFVVN